VRKRHSVLGHKPIVGTPYSSIRADSPTQDMARPLVALPHAPYFPFLRALLHLGFKLGLCLAAPHLLFSFLRAFFS